ncbi:hypothetical protein ACFL2L_00895 [Patescibacteria group bacterium]
MIEEENKRLIFRLQKAKKMKSISTKETFCCLNKVILNFFNRSKKQNIFH